MFVSRNEASVAEETFNDVDNPVRGSWSLIVLNSRPFDQTAQNTLCWLSKIPPTAVLLLILSVLNAVLLKKLVCVCERGLVSDVSPRSFLCLHHWSIILNCYSPSEEFNYDQGRLGFKILREDTTVTFNTPGGNLDCLPHLQILQFKGKE